MQSLIQFRVASRPLEVPRLPSDDAIYSARCAHPAQDGLFCTPSYNIPLSAADPCCSPDRDKSGGGRTALLSASPSPLVIHAPPHFPGTMPPIPPPPADPPVEAGAADARLAAFRAQLAASGLDAFVIPTADPHNSEGPPPAFARRSFLSGFTGSAGTALVSATGAWLWTDGRYFLQASRELSTSWTLMRSGLGDTPTLAAHLGAVIPSGGVVGIDPLVHSIDGARELAEALTGKAKGGGATGSAGGTEGSAKDGPSPRRLQHVAANPVDAVWAAARPPLPTSKARVHHLKYAGMGVAEKLGRLREAMAEEGGGCEGGGKGVDLHVVSMLDEVAWLTNIRGSDVPNTPTVLAYASVGLDTAVLYTSPDKVGADVASALQSAGVEVRPYDAVLSDTAAAAAAHKRVWLDPTSTSVALYDAACGKTAGGKGSPNQGRVVLKPTPVSMFKAVKNEAEMAGMRAAHVRDSAALSAFLAWLSTTLTAGKAVVTELSASAKLETYRAAQDGFLFPSFETISGVGPNGAVIHYSATKAGSTTPVTTAQIYLLDSGGQYVDGTTDVTRTSHFGAPSRHERACFTRVLQGHIALASAVFPAGTTGLMLDGYARRPLWAAGLDYRHGTGHGVGAGLNVHEGPQSISPRPGSNKWGIVAGMVVSNEPGYYQEGEDGFGIRIENLVEVVEVATKHRFGEGPYLGFKELTLVPIDRSLILTEMLNVEEMAWVDAYHTRVRDEVGPAMPCGDTVASDWLQVNTEPLVPAAA